MGGPYIVPGPARPAGLRAVGDSDGLVRLQLPAEGACHRMALRLLHARSVPAARVVAVYPYAVAFVHRKGGVATAWTYRQGLDGQERLTVTWEWGLPPFPGAA